MRPTISALISREYNHWDTPLGFFERHTDIFYDRPRDPLRNLLHDDFIAGPTARRMLAFHQDIAEIPHEDWDIVKIQKTLNVLKQEIPTKSVGEHLLTAQKRSYQYLRWALYGGRSGPDLASIMYYLGRDKTLGRLELAEKDLREAMQEHGHMK